MTMVDQVTGVSGYHPRMTDTKNRRGAADQPGTDLIAPTSAAGSENTTTQGPAPAVSFAGSGTTEPIELNPSTHGNHYRGSQGDI